MSGPELISLGGVFLIIYVLTGSVAFLGGFIVTAGAGVQHMRRSKKVVKDANGAGTQEDSEAGKTET